MIKRAEKLLARFEKAHITSHLRSCSARRHSFATHIQGHVDELLEVENHGTLPAGIDIIPNYLTQTEHDAVLKEIEQILSTSAASKNLQFKRRITNLYPEAKIRSACPKSFEIMSRVFAKEGLLDVNPDGMQINEYDADGGCPPHVDAISIGPVIAMFSFCSPCVMNFSPEVKLTREMIIAARKANIDASTIEDKDGLKFKALLEPRSLIVLRDEARNSFRHGVVPAPFHTFRGKTIEKGHRFSLVFWRTLNSSPSTMMKPRNR